MQSTFIVTNSQQVDCAFPAASVRGFERLIPLVSLPDPDDRHILAAAVHARADLLVTANLKDFPSASLSSFGVAAVHLDPFVDFLFDLDEFEAIVAVTKLQADSERRRLAPTISLMPARRSACR